MPPDKSGYWKCIFPISHPKHNYAAVLSATKAFDKVSHWRLSHKWDYYGIRGSTHKWVDSWLSGLNVAVFCLQWDLRFLHSKRKKKQQSNSVILEIVPSWYIFFYYNLKENVIAKKKNIHFSSFSCLFIFHQFRRWIRILYNFSTGWILKSPLGEWPLFLKWR